MHKNKLFKLVLKVLIVIFSYGYIYYKFNTLHIEWATFKALNIEYLALAIALMPLNWLLESFKWRFLLKDIQQISLKQSLIGVLIGITSGMATPNRIGEYIGRSFILKKNNRVKGSLATVLGSLSQILITLIFGLLGWLILFNRIQFFDHLEYKSLFLIILIGLMSTLMLIFYNLRWVQNLAKWLTINQKYIDKIRFLTKYKNPELSFIIFLSFFRYVVFAIQYVLLLRYFGLNIPLLDTLSAIGLIYLIIVFIPHFSITELGVRGSIAILIFQNFTTEHHLIAMAATILWLINLSIPSIIGSILIFNKKAKTA